MTHRLPFSVNFLVISMTGKILKILQKPILSAFRALYPLSIPKNATMRNEYGTENVKFLTSHFETVLASDASLILSGYALFKKYCQKNIFQHVALQMLSKDNILRCKFLKIASFCEFALTIPASNAWFERGFFAPGRIKSKTRN